MNENRFYLQTKFSVKMKIINNKKFAKTFMGGNFPGGNFPGNNFLRGIFPIGIFPGAFFLEPGKAIE